MNNYDYIEGVEFNGLIPAIMEQEGVKTIGNELEVIDFVGTAFGDKEDNENNEGGDDDTHEYVDLGLPSGTLWATENIKDENGNDLYFAWGETSGYTSGQVGTDKYFAFFDREHADYKFGAFDLNDETNSGATKYNSTDGKTTLDAEDDAATANWGSSWKMPTKEQCEELTANTTTAWTQVYGVNGLLCTSTANTNTLFFPAVGNAGDGEVNDIGSYGGCWSVSLNDIHITEAYFIFFGIGECEVVYDSRCYGYSVRPVFSQNL